MVRFQRRCDGGGGEDLQPLISTAAKAEPVDGCDNSMAATKSSYDATECLSMRLLHSL